MTLRRNAAILLVVTALVPVSCRRRSDGERVPEAEAATRPPTAEAIGRDEFLEAAHEGDLETVRAALEAGTPAAEPDDQGRTALMLAAFNGHTGVVRLLLDAGAALDARDRFQRTALMYACSGPNDETVRLLLDRKAGVNLADGEENWTPLMFAAAEGHVGIVRMLLASGADPHAKDIDGEDAEMFARSRRHPEAADLIRAAKSR